MIFTKSRLRAESEVISGSYDNPSPPRQSLLPLALLYSSSFLSFSSLPHPTLSPIGFPFAFPSHSFLPLSLRETIGQMGVGDQVPGFSPRRVVIMRPSIFLVEGWLMKHPHQTLLGLLTAPQPGRVPGRTPRLHREKAGEVLARSALE